MCQHSRHRRDNCQGMQLFLLTVSVPSIESLNDHAYKSLKTRLNGLADRVQNVFKYYSYRYQLVKRQ